MATHFETIEGAYEYVVLLGEALEENCSEIEAEIVAAGSDPEDRKRQALMLVSYELRKLAHHISASRRILNDLRSLRRLLVGEGSRSADPNAGIEPALDEINLYSA